MARIYLWVGAALIVWLYRYYSFWAVFGWAYGFACAALIVICFSKNRRLDREPVSELAGPLQAQLSEDQ